MDCFVERIFSALERFIGRERDKLRYFRGMGPMMAGKARNSCEITWPQEVDPTYLVLRVSCEPDGRRDQGLHWQLVFRFEGADSIP